MTNTESESEMTIEPEVAFNMDLANGPTSERFCYEAMQVLETTMSNDDANELRNDGEFASEVVDEWTSRLEGAGYCVVWDAGDVVVYDLRPYSDDQREEFYETLQ